MTSVIGLNLVNYKMDIAYILKPFRWNSTLYLLRYLEEIRLIKILFNRYMKLKIIGLCLFSHYVLPTSYIEILYITQDQL